MFNPVKISVNLNDVALQAIFKEASASRDGKETGGILLGHDLDATGTIAVIEAGDPGPGAVRRRDFFRRDLDYAQRLADVAFRQHQAVWVGEWHTHVVGDDVPSGLDLKTYRGFLADSELDFEVFLSIIVTPKEEGRWQNCQLTTWAIGREENLVKLDSPLEGGGRSNAVS